MNTHQIVQDLDTLVIEELEELALYNLRNACQRFVEEADGEIEYRAATPQSALDHD